jgi:hypothetical protein
MPSLRDFEVVIGLYKHKRGERTQRTIAVKKHYDPVFSLSIYLRVPGGKLNLVRYIHAVRIIRRDRHG